ncbi:MAG: hypothetical protein RLZZ272_41 [Actinomycetota bacterium]
MTTRRRRLLGATALVALVAMLPFVAALATMRLAERPEAVLGPVDGLPPEVAPGPGCIARGPEPVDARTDLVPVVPPGARVGSSTVLRCPAAFDGLEVTFVGEVVGDVLPRRGGAWVLVNDDAYALTTGPLPGHRTFAGSNSGLAVWLPDPLVDGLSEPGRPGRRGDVVVVTGRIVRVDPDDSGGLTLRAETVRIAAPGTDVATPLDVPLVLLALVLLALAGAVRLRRR